MTPFNQRRLLKNQFESIKRPSNLWHRKKLDRQTGCSLAHSPCLKQVGSCSACSINWIYTSSWNLKGLSYLLSLVLSEKTLHFIAINGQTDASKLSTLGGELLFLIWTRIPRFRILPCKILCVIPLCRTWQRTQLRAWFLTIKDSNPSSATYQVEVNWGKFCNMAKDPLLRV